MNRTQQTGTLDTGTQAKWSGVWFVALTVLFMILNFSGAQALTSTFLPIVASASAGILARRYPTFAICANMWLWLTVAEFRRLSDWVNGYQSNSIWLVCPVIASIAALAVLIRPSARMTLNLTTGILLSCYILAVALATVTGLLTNGLLATAAGAFVWLAPLLLGVLVLLAGASRATLRGAVTFVFLPWLTIAGIYGVVQYYFLPSWDSAWMLNVRPSLTSIGFPFPQEFRVYSISNAPGPFAGVVVALVLASGAHISKHKWTVILIAPAFVALALSLVRASWIALAVALIAATLLRLLRFRSIILIALVAFLAISLVPQASLATIASRFDTLSTGTQDDSLAARIAFHQAALPVVLSDPIGEGLGASGSAARYSTGSQVGSQIANRGDFDGGFLETSFTFGALFGSALIIALALRSTVLLSWPRADPVRAWSGLAVLSLFVQLFFGNTLTGVQGAIFLLMAFTQWSPPPPLDPRVDRVNANHVADREADHPHPRLVTPRMEGTTHA